MIILISGKQGSGKTTLSTGLAKALDQQKSVSAVTQIKFADPLYQMHDFCLDILAKNGIKRNIVKDGELLQYLGTEWGRKTVDNDIWAKIAFNKASKLSDLRSVVIIDDCRFENEFSIFGDKALKVRIECPEKIRKQRCSYWRKNTKHPSEIGLDDFSKKKKFDLTLRSDKLSKQEMVREVVKAWKKLSVTKP